MIKLLQLCDCPSHANSKNVLLVKFIEVQLTNVLAQLHKICIVRTRLITVKKQKHLNLATWFLKPISIITRPLPPQG